MNKIIREHYPASKLPEDLRGAVDPSSTVTVTIAVEEAPQPTQIQRRLADLLAQARRSPPADDDPVDRIRELRDEWDR